MSTPTLCTPGDSRYIPQLVLLLQDAVTHGASVGFMAPLDAERAHAYWARVFSSLDDSLFLWITQVQGRITGSVQLALCPQDNAGHRAEIQKLFVLSSRRGQGLSSRLMHAAESHAAALGRTLLVLDTQAGSQAESVYRHLGWRAAGQIPDYAQSPEGRLHTTAYFYKRVGAGADGGDSC